MKNESTRKKINVDKPNYSSIWAYKQEDDGVLKLALFKDSTPLDITGQTIKLGAKRPNNSIIELTEGFKINNNELDIKLKNNILAVPGIVECDLEITDEVGRMTTASFYLTINKKITGEDNLNASNDISAINKIVEEVLAKGKELDSNIKVLVEQANKKITTIDTALNQKLNEMQADYNSLQKIIIDENQAANLQNQVNKTNAQLDTNVRGLDVKKANQSDLIIERKRIDNLSKLNEGSTTGDAELIDARIGVNGVNYNNIGSAIREQLKNSISSNIITTSFTLDNSFNGGLLKSAMCLFKGQTVQICIEDTNGILDKNGTFSFGVIDLEGNQINNLCKIKANEIGEFTAPNDIKQIVFWVAANLKVSNGDVNLIIKHKQNIYEEITDLNNKVYDLNNNSDVIKLNLFGSDKPLFKNTISKNATVGSNLELINPVSINAGETIYIELDTDSVDANLEIPIAINYENTGEIGNLLKIKPNQEYSYTINNENATYVKAWISLTTILSNGTATFTISNYSKATIKDEISSLRGEITSLRSEINNSNKSNISNLNFSIIGDSYSTYKKWISDAYLPWYTDEGNTKDNNVTSVKQTWWWKLSNETGMSLLTNSSYSGSTICNTWYNSEDISGSNKSFLTRIKKDIGENNTLKNKPNIIFIFGGTNDKWAKSPVGSVKYDSWSNDDLKNVLPAFCYLIDYLKLWNPQARIINIVNDLLSDEIKNGMTQACNYYNIENLILTDIEKENDHPNINGMERIKQQIKEIL